MQENQRVSISLIEEIINTMFARLQDRKDFRTEIIERLRTLASDGELGAVSKVKDALSLELEGDL